MRPLSPQKLELSATLLTNLTGGDLPQILIDNTSPTTHRYCTSHLELPALFTPLSNVILNYTRSGTLEHGPNTAKGFKRP